MAAIDFEEIIFKREKTKEAGWRQDGGRWNFRINVFEA
jgi:hypothetical protein